MLASSSHEDDLEHFLEELEVKELVDDWTTSDDVERTKPHPDVIRAALEKAGTDDAVMVGDARWDIEDATNAGLQTVCVITGGLVGTGVARPRGGGGLRVARRAEGAPGRNTARRRLSADTMGAARWR